MTKEEKELLLKDLCARLPYGVIVQDRNGVHALTQGNTEFTDLFNGKCNIKPYLRPLSSMTEEEKEEYCLLEDEVLCSSGRLLTDNINDMSDWLLSKHFDTRSLIEKGLAIDCTNLKI